MPAVGRLAARFAEGLVPTMPVQDLDRGIQPARIRQVRRLSQCGGPTMTHEVAQLEEEASDDHDRSGSNDLATRNQRARQQRSRAALP
jgi:hypothetical protein